MSTLYAMVLSRRVLRQIFTQRSRSASTSEGFRWPPDSWITISTLVYSRSTSRSSAASNGKSKKHLLEAATNTPQLLLSPILSLGRTCTSLATGGTACEVRTGRHTGSLPSEGTPWQHQGPRRPPVVAFVVAWARIGRWGVVADSNFPQKEQPWIRTRSQKGFPSRWCLWRMSTRVPRHPDAAEPASWAPC